MKRKLTALILAAAMAVSLFGCGNSNDTPSPAASDTEAAGSTEPSGEPAADETTAEVWGGEYMKERLICCALPGVAKQRQNCPDTC